MPGYWRQLACVDCARIASLRQVRTPAVARTSRTPVSRVAADARSDAGAPQPVSFGVQQGATRASAASSPTRASSTCSAARRRSRRARSTPGSLGPRPARDQWQIATSPQVACSRSGQIGRHLRVPGDAVLGLEERAPKPRARFIFRRGHGMPRVARAPFWARSRHTTPKAGPAETWRVTINFRPFRAFRTSRHPAGARPMLSQYARPMAERSARRSLRLRVRRATVPPTPPWLAARILFRSARRALRRPDRRSNLSAR